MYSNPAGHPQYTNPHRMNSTNARYSSNPSNNDHPDRRSWHGDDYADDRHRKEKPAMKNK